MAFRPSNFFKLSYQNFAASGFPEVDYLSLKYSHLILRSILGLLLLPVDLKKKKREREGLLIPIIHLTTSDSNAFIEVGI